MEQKLTKLTKLNCLTPTWHEVPKPLRCLRDLLFKTSRTSPTQTMEQKLTKLNCLTPTWHEAPKPLRAFATFCSIRVQPSRTQSHKSNPDYGTEANEVNEAKLSYPHLAGSPKAPSLPSRPSVHSESNSAALSRTKIAVQPAIHLLLWRVRRPFGPGAK
jgi:hypothetical protein